MLEMCVKAGAAKPAQQNGRKKKKIMYYGVKNKEVDRRQEAARHKCYTSPRFSSLSLASLAIGVCSVRWSAVTQRRAG